MVMTWGGRGPREAPARPMPRTTDVPVRQLAEVLDLDVVVDLRDAGRCPGGSDGLVVLGPGAHDSGEGHRPGGGGDRLAVGVQPGAARERAAVVVLDVAPVGRGDQLDLILDGEDARHICDDELGLVTLVLPAGGAGQGDEAAGHPGVDSGRDEAVEYERLEDVSAQLGVLTPVLVQDPHLKLVVDGSDPVNALGGLLGLALLSEAADGSAQGDVAAAGGY